MRRRVLWIGLFVTTVGATTWAVLARRSGETAPFSPSTDATPHTQAEALASTNGRAPSGDRA